MPADLVPHNRIPELAARVTPEMLKVLKHLHKADFIWNDSTLEPNTVTLLTQLTTLGLVDAPNEGDTNRPPSIWVANGNGSRVLVYMTGIRGGPHYEVPASELAAWLEQQGSQRWWNVDGDPLLTGRLTFPCPAKILSEELLAINKPLLLQAKQGDTSAKGQLIDRAKLDAVVDRVGSNAQTSEGSEAPPWSTDRILYLCWKGVTNEWLLAEDSETTELMAADQAVVTDRARVKRQ
jgi:hypothetical protein